MSLLITSTRKGAGKTMVGLGIGLNYPGKVGFFKPLGTNLVQGADEDVILFKKVFQLEEAPHLFNVSHDYHRILHDVKEPDHTERLTQQYTQLHQGKDFMIIETAHTLSYGSYMGLSAPQIAAGLDVPGLLVAEGEPERIVDKSIIARHCFNVQNAVFLGVVVNKAESFEEKYKHQLQERGVTVLGVIPEYEELKTPTCEDIIDALDGELIAGEEGLYKKVETTVVGAMTYDSAQRTLQQMEFPERSVMVTGGERADMQLLAFDMKSSLLVLTGGTYPSAAVLAKADELKTPVVMVTYDTLTAASRCEQTAARLRPDHAPLIKEVVKKHVDAKRLCGAAGK
ncbi:MAG: phosphotransacetylase family protein [Theionarchaea archaeon]|nr:phosphotransacetylase family protein [Theionarchaea archaeon]